MQIAHQGSLRKRRNQARLPRGAHGAGQEGNTKDADAAQIASQVVPPVVAPVSKQKEGYRAVKSYEDVPHVGVIIGANGMLDLFAVPEQQCAGQQDQWKGDSQDPDGPSHGIIGDDLGWFVHLLMLGPDFHNSTTEFALTQ